MEPTIAGKLKEIGALAYLARQKRKELEDELSKLSRERFFHLQQAEQRRKAIRELRKGIQQLPPVPVKDLGSITLKALRTGPGAKTLRDICEITGITNKAVSRCLQTLVKQGRVKRLLEDGRKRGASYEAVAPWLLKDPHPRPSAGRKPNTSQELLERIYLAAAGQPWTADGFLRAIETTTGFTYSRSRVFALLKTLNDKFLGGSRDGSVNTDRVTFANDKTIIQHEESPDRARNAESSANPGS